MGKSHQPERHRDRLSQFHREIFSSQIKTRVQQIRDKYLGPREERTRERAKRVDGVLTGGFRAERFEDKNEVKGTRCQTMATSYQGPKMMSAPNKGGKLLSGWRESLTEKKEFVNVSFSRSLHLHLF